VGFEPVEQNPSLPDLEESVMARWAERDVFARVAAPRSGADPFVVYEGPPTANGPPGVHHVPNRTFKDVFLRYHRMKGYQAIRRQGWDCHGIPVELEIERELGFTRKREIEDFGVAEFNDRCRASVERYVDHWVPLNNRVGFWCDLEHTYWTMAPYFVDSVWWALKTLWERGFIYESYKVVPYCPRCGTALSDHEVDQGRTIAKSDAVSVKLPLLEGPLAAEGASLLVWTTTPWTLFSNAGAAIGKDVRYVLVQPATDADDPAAGGPLVVAAARVEATFGEDVKVLRDVALDELAGMHYRAPFDHLSIDDVLMPSGGEAATDWHYVIPADFVTTKDGTGIVHIAPGFGPDDMALAHRHGLPILEPTIDGEGRFDARVPFLEGLFFKDGIPLICEELRARGLLHRWEQHEHAYPFCWRCQTPLLHYAKPSWYIETTKVRDRMLELNAGVDWHPPQVRDGRYGNWLEGNVDWALSRERYWGTPMPFWRCERCEHLEIVGSRAELGRLAGRDLSELDPHRPYVDDVTFACRECGGEARRIPEVADVWFDSGCMSFAQFGYPHVEGSAERFAGHFPASLIAEGMDQTRGWFYSLMAVTTLMLDVAGYERVLCLGLVVDADGKKMSKSRRNVIDPWELISRFGADPLRWLIVTGGSPWVEQRVGYQPIEDVIRRFFLTLWNTYTFFVTYARIDGWTPALEAPPAAERPVIDRWALADLADTVAAADASFSDLDAPAAGRRVERFVEDLSNWYVRLNRARFWASGDTPDKRAAHATLHTCLVGVSRLLAPLVPFVADELHENLVRSVDPTAADSVHLVDFPAPDHSAADEAVRTAMAAARRVVELGRRVRNEAAIVLRQPLRTAIVTLPAGERAVWPQVADLVAGELNVKEVRLLEATGEVVAHKVSPNFRELGPAFGKRAPAVAEALRGADPEAVVSALDEAGEVRLDVGGEQVTVTAAQVEVSEQPRTGWLLADDGPYAVALDVTVDDELRVEGLARDLARAINAARRRAEVAIDDRIRLTIDGDEDVERALETHGDWVAGEVLAVEIRRRDLPEGGETLELASGARARIVVERP
jgi:isoleucyl-tRNA synthetase